MTQRVTLDDLYRRSSQYRKWSFTKDELKLRRTFVNEKGSKKVDERLAAHPEIDPSTIQKVTVEEELKLIAFHLKTIGTLAKYFNMPSQVRATAISFLRRFYLVNSVMEYDPVTVLLTCLFLAAKSENFFIGIDSFCRRIHDKIPKATPASILSLEFEILQSFQFTLMVHHPYRPLYGFFFDFQQVLKDEVPVKELGKAYDNARNLVNEALITDTVYHFTPPQIALACFRESNSALTEKYLKKKFGLHPKKEEEEEEGEETKSINSEGSIPQNQLSYDELDNLISECQALIRTAVVPSREDAAAVDKKVQYCLNPLIVLKRRRDEPATNTESSKKQRIDSTETPV